MAAGSASGAGILVSEYLDQWLTHVRTRMRVKTWEGYEVLLRRYARPALGEVTALDVQRLYGELMSREDRPLAGGTVLNLHLLLTQSFGQAVRWGMLDKSPTMGAQPPRPRRSEPAVIDAALARRLLEAVAGTPYELPAQIALGTGMRRGEIVGLRWIGSRAGLLSRLRPALGASV
jgi:integrase